MGLNSPSDVSGPMQRIIQPVPVTTPRSLPLLNQIQVLTLVLPVERPVTTSSAQGVGLGVSFTAVKGQRLGQSSNISSNVRSQLTKREYPIDEWEATRPQRKNTRTFRQLAAP